MHFVERDYLGNQTPHFQICLSKQICPQSDVFVPSSDVESCLMHTHGVGADSSLNLFLVYHKSSKSTLNQ